MVSKERDVVSAHCSGCVLVEKRADALAGRGGLDFRAEFCSRGLLDDGVVERALDLVLHAEHVRELVLENPLREEGADADGGVDDRERKRRPARVDGGENDGVEVERLPDEADAAAHHHGGGRAEDGGLRNAQDAVLHRARNVGGVECEALAEHVPEVEREPAQKVLHRQQAQQAACAGLDLQEFAALHLA